MSDDKKHERSALVHTKDRGLTTRSSALVRRALESPLTQKAISNSIGMEFVRIPAGQFWMGSDHGNALERLSATLTGNPTRLVKQTSSIELGTPKTPAIGPNRIPDGALVGSELVQAGIKEREAWDEKMIELIGPDIIPFLGAIWDATSARLESQGIDTSYMDERSDKAVSAEPDLDGLRNVKPDNGPSTSERHQKFEKAVLHRIQKLEARNQKYVYVDERPVHRVTISQSYYMGKYEVTQGQWQVVMGNNPSSFTGDDSLPVEKVSWNDAQGLIKKLNEMNDGYKYRLPTEAEWEYACRAETTTEFSFGSSLSSEQANFEGNYPYGKTARGIYRIGTRTNPVGSFAPNAFGLYDMLGNVWEWCEDLYHDSYEGAPSDGSAWLSGGEQKSRVLRGGSWDNYASNLRSALRYHFTPDGRSFHVGLRLVAAERTP